MPLREVKPLTAKQWEQVQRMFREGPTPESMRIRKEALARAAKIKDNY